MHIKNDDNFFTLDFDYDELPGTFRCRSPACLLFWMIDQPFENNFGRIETLHMQEFILQREFPKMYYFNILSIKLNI